MAVGFSVFGYLLVLIFFLYPISRCGAKSNRIDIFVRSYESINMINMSEEKDHLYGKKVNNGKTKLCTDIVKDRDC